MKTYLPGLFLILLSATLLTGCEGTQSTLAPFGDTAGSVAMLSWVIFFGGGVILAAVLAFAAYAILATPQRRGWLAQRGFVVAGGIVFPIVTLSVLLIYGLTLTRPLSGTPGEAPLQIEVTGEQYWWRIAYMGENGEPAFETANEIHIPVGRPVELSLKTADVIHSFWVPGLSGKLDMIPGLTNSLRVRASQAAAARGQCAEYCGTQHAQMAFAVTAAPPAEYDDWLARESAPAAEPQTGQAQTGRDLFVSAGCGACHTIRGTAAVGEIGPDLTHFASRRYIGAGALPNETDNLVNWIANAGHFKPGNKMPPFAALPAEQLDAIAAYLESLK